MDNFILDTLGVLHINGGAYQSGTEYLTVIVIEYGTNHILLNNLCQ